jgi:hypothetical protein
MLKRVAAVLLLTATFATAAQAEELTQGEAWELDLPGIEIAADVEELANEVGLEPILLQGAVNSVKTPPRTYLQHEGLLEPPAPTPARSPAGAVPVAPASVMNRVACIEAKESGGANVANARGSGAGGVMQYMDSTFAAHAREMGHPEWSKWNPVQARAVAAHDLQMGRRAQWDVGGC